MIKSVSKFAQVLVVSIKPTGILGLSHYLGLVRLLLKYQKRSDFKIYIVISDLEAMSAGVSAKLLEDYKKQTVALLLACGIDYKKCAIYFQSSLAAHSYLAWLLTCQSQMGQLLSLDIFKNNHLENGRQNQSVPTGSLVGPILKITNGLLYNSDLVIIKDQQVFKLAVALTKRLNRVYQLNFKISKNWNTKQPVIMALDNPLKPMAKVVNSCDLIPKGTISLLDDPDWAYQKIQRAKTDSENKIYWDEQNEQKAGIRNLLTIYASIKQLTIKAACVYFKDCSYQVLKQEVGLVVKNLLIAIQKRYQNMNDLKLERAIAWGTNQANRVATSTIKIIKKQFGF